MAENHSQWKEAGCGPYPVTIIPNYTLTLTDGTEISLKIWYPARTLSGTDFEGTEHYLEWDPKGNEVYQSGTSEDGPVSPLDKPLPAIFEYLAYRHSDFTLENDVKRHTWWSSHGYIDIRCDMRGSGCSQGRIYGECLEPEQADGEEIIAWIAAQPWCSGDVGMCGHSWGGINSLMMAFLKPPALKVQAIITTYGTDDRYVDDFHHMVGGGFLGTNTIYWSTMVSTLNLIPPNPRLTKDWRRVWQDRIDNASAPWILEWLRHQTRDEMWTNASCIEDKSRIQIPVLAFGGFQDIYRNAVFSMAQYMNKFRGVVGPWSHTLPDVEAPGPAINYNVECLKWWDCHLKGINNDVMEEPKLRLYLQEGQPPQRSYKFRPGYWLSEKSWPPTGKNRYLSFTLDGSNKLVEFVSEEQRFAETVMAVRYDGRSGLGGMRWITSGLVDDLPVDQSHYEKYGVCWYSGPTDQDVAILGQPTLHCTVAVENSDTGVLIARLCEVFPDGSSTLLSYGVLNLNHYKGHGPDEVTALEPRKECQVKVNFMATSCIVKKSHKLSLGISSSHFPMIWPSKDPVQLNIHAGSSTRLVLPVRPTDSLDDDVTFEWVPNYPSNVKVIKEGSNTKTVTEAEDGSDQNSVFLAESDAGTVLVKPTNTIIHGKHTVERYEISNTDPLSTQASVINSIQFDWPDGDGSRQQITAKISVFGELWADREQFHTRNKAKVHLNGEIVFDKMWEESCPRNFS